MRTPLITTLLTTSVAKFKPLLLAISIVSVAVGYSLFADPACTVPGVTTVVDSGTNDAFDTQAIHDIVNCSVAYPFTTTSAPDTLTFTIKVASLSTLTPSSAYFVSFTIDGAAPAAGTVHGVRMNVDQAGAVTFATYVAGASNGGTVDGRFVASTTPAEAGSNYTADGTITIIAKPSRLGVPTTGTHKLTNWDGAVAQTAGGVATAILDAMPSSTGSPPSTIIRGGDDFTIMSNQTCNVNATPTPTPTATPTPTGACGAPYIQVQDGAASAKPDPTMQFAIERVNMGEPFVSCNSKRLTVVMKVPTMDPRNNGTVQPPPNGFWDVLMTVPGNANSTGQPKTIFVEFETSSNPSGAFHYGWYDATTNFNWTEATPLVTGTVLPDGTITMNFNVSGTINFTTPTGSMAPPWSISPTQWAPGLALESIQGATSILVGVAGNGFPQTMAQTTGDGKYTIAGNLACSSPPVAALSAAPTSGSAPLTVNFDASASTAGQCGTIDNYIFTFGDGQQATQGAGQPTISHTYNTGGTTYSARVRVTNTSGLTSGNIAQKDITVNPAGPPILTSVVSRKTHGAAGDFDIALPQAPATRAVECRSGGGTNDYQLIFSFLNNLTSVGAATVTGGAGSVSSAVLLGPNANECTVNLTGVTNAQSTTVTVTNVLDSTGALGDVSGKIGVLLGDTTNDATVNSGDIAQTKSQSGHVVDSSNFRQDVTVDGTLNSGDIASVKSRSGTALPP